MKVLIGIYQKMEQAQTYLQNKGRESRVVVEVGPFSRMQALAWMDHMEQRLDQPFLERFTLGSLYPDIWYGATFETD